MAYTQIDLDTLDKAITGAVLEIELDGRKVKYRNMGELLQARAHVAAVLSSAASAQRTGAYRFKFTTSRGD